MKIRFVIIVHSLKIDHKWKLDYVYKVHIKNLLFRGAAELNPNQISTGRYLSCFVPQPSPHIHRHTHVDRKRPNQLVK